LITIQLAKPSNADFRRLNRWNLNELYQEHVSENRVGDPLVIRAESRTDRRKVGPNRFVILH